VADELLGRQRVVDAELRQRPGDAVSAYVFRRGAIPCNVTATTIVSASSS
jgi:hypothetical protein